MPSFRIAYKSDAFGNAIYARVSWSKGALDSTRPIAVVYHAGGLVAGSSEIIPKTEVEYLCSKNLVVVIPNYRLIPQVTGKDAFADSEEAFDWTLSTLPDIMQSQHQTRLDTNRVVVIGHSSGGSMALSIASRKSVRAATAFYPFIFVSDPSTNAHKPTTTWPFGDFPDYTPGKEDWKVISPEDQQISESPLMSPDTPLSPRNKWMVQIFKSGQWLRNAQPDGNYATIDPVGVVDRPTAESWAPTMIVHGSDDFVPGRSLELVQRAERKLKDVGVKELQVEIVEGAGHLFDHEPSVGTTDLGAKWQAVVKGLEWVCSRV